MKLEHPRGTATYKKKPVAVYAVRFNPMQRNWPPQVYSTGFMYFVGTANGPVQINEGTWICWQNVNRKVDAWPVAPHIFERTYIRAPSTRATHSSNKEK